ncbi:dehydrase and lipid transport-domain-containing protein [Mycena floridula]|nr:dehydrase and lipid transport-domain-containing protein [Mycena floridula]
MQGLQLLRRPLTRTFISFPSFPLLDPGPQTYQERKILAFTQQELYNVVSNVQSYHHFVPFCTQSRVIQQRTDDRNVLLMDAELTVGFLAFNESYVSQVTCKPFEEVKAVASSTTPLFKSLSTCWRFEPTSDGARSTLVTLDLAYAFQNPLHAAVSSSFFGQVSKQMVKAFEERCKTVHGFK